jgi:hypothetical protein
MKASHMHPRWPSRLHFQWNSGPVSAELNVVAPVGRRMAAAVREPGVIGWTSSAAGSSSRVGDSVRAPSWPSNLCSTWPLLGPFQRQAVGLWARQNPTSRRHAALASWKPLCSVSFC